MFGPFIEIWEWVKAHNPGSPFKKRHLSFITVHCKMQSRKASPALVTIGRTDWWRAVIDIYITGITILGSILLYPAGNMRYIDALFFSAGAATQSGLNT